MTVSEAETAPDKYRVVEVPFGQRNEWVNNRELDAEFTYIIDNDGCLAGAAAYGAEAAFMIDFLTLIIANKMTAETLRRMIFAFPTQTYSVISGLTPLLIPR